MSNEVGGTLGPAAIVGAGLIGQSWAALMIAHGVDVRVWDPNAAALDAFGTGVSAMRAQLRDLVPDDASNGEITICRTLPECVAGAVLIQENAPEKADLKRSLYAEIEAACGPEAIIASSTSSLTWTELSPGMQDAGRLITAHPFNPPHLMPLVELYGPDAPIVDRAAAFYTALDRVCVRLKKPATGHIANRLSSALWREAVNMVAEGIADVPDIDAALVHGPGLRWSVIGAHMAYHLGGGAGGIEHYLSHLGPSQERRWRDLGNPSLTAEVQAALVSGVMDEADGASVAELAARRDERLLRVLGALNASEQTE